MQHDISNSADVIDSRDIIARIEELEDNRQEMSDNPDDGTLSPAEWDASDDGQELATLKALAEEAEGYAPDWPHGETLIRDSYFEQYAQELCEDIGDIPKDLPSYFVIDWEATAENIRQDYTSLEYDGVTYWIR